MTINVNLKPCNCPQAKRLSGLHDIIDCASVPCPIPSSFTVEVRLGECTCSADVYLPALMSPANGVQHYPACPARPVKVSCSIGGDGTWEGSEVEDWQPVGPGGRFVLCDTPAQAMALGDACRARWEIVKALVTGRFIGAGGPLTGEHGDLIQQRDAVFSVLAEQARMEQAAFEAQERATRAMGEPTFLPDNFIRAEPERRASAGLLERYVTRLVAQVGAL